MHHAGNPDENKEEVLIQAMQRDMTTRGINTPSIVNAFARAIAQTGLPAPKLARFLPFEAHIGPRALQEFGFRYQH